MTDRPRLRLPPDASPDEAAAIIAAIEQLLAVDARAAAPSGWDDPWAGRRFAFAGRLTRLTGEAPPFPAGLPADPWTAAGRLERR